MKTKRFRKNTRQIFEALEAEWDDDALRAKVRIIQSGVSHNNRQWTASALKQAAESGFWDGTRMFLDHPKDKSRLPSKVLDRSVKDMVSAIESTVWVPTGNGEGKVVGDVQFFDEKFYSFARRAQEHLGASVNLIFAGHAEQRQGKRFEVVESLEHSKSVDWVPFPGAGGAIEEFIGTEGVDDVDWDEVTVEMLKEHRPDLVEAFESAQKDEEEPPKDPGRKSPRPPKPSVVPQYITKDEFTKMLGEARESWEEGMEKRSKATTQARERIVASKLPARTQTRLMSAFEAIDEYDEKAVDAAIQSARDELKEAIGPRMRGLGMSGVEGDGENPAKDLVEAAPLHLAMESAFGNYERRNKKADSQEGAN